MKKLLLILLLISPASVSDMDNVCAIYTEKYGLNAIAKGIDEQGCVRDNILQVVYGMNNPQEDMLLIQSGRWCRFDRNRDIRGASLSCVLYSTNPRERLDLIK